MSLYRFSELRDVSSPEDLRVCVEQIALQMGFPLFGYIYTRRDPGGRLQRLVAQNVPIAFLERASDPSVSRRDPVMARVRMQTMPFVYDQRMYVEAGAADIWEEQAPFGYKHGIATAVQLSRSERLCFGFDRSEGIAADLVLRSRLLEDLSTVAYGAARVLSGTLTPGASTGDEHRRVTELSRRRLQTLYWASFGHSNEEIAEVLGLSPATVQNHMRACQEKLGTTNRVHTVAEAIRLNLLDDSLAELN